MRKLLFAAVSVGLLASAAPSVAAPCRDAKGKFIKCPSAAPVKAARCKDAKGKFAKCGTPGAKRAGSIKERRGLAPPPSRRRFGVEAGTDVATFKGGRRNRCGDTDVIRPG